MRVSLIIVGVVAALVTVLEIVIELVKRRQLRVTSQQPTP